MTTVTQVSVFAENNTDQLHQVLAPMAAAGVNLRAFSIAEAPDFGVLRFIVDAPEKALEALTAAGFRVKLTPVHAVQLRDVPGALDEVCKAPAEANISIDYMYAFAAHTQAAAITILRTPDPEGAEKALTAKGMKLIDMASLLAL